MGISERKLMCLQQIGQKHFRNCKRDLLADFHDVLNRLKHDLVQLLNVHSVGGVRQV
jgi:hypothetical protein